MIKYVNANIHGASLMILSHPKLELLMIHNKLQLLKGLHPSGTDLIEIGRLMDLRESHYRSQVFTEADIDQYLLSIKFNSVRKWLYIFKIKPQTIGQELEIEYDTIFTIKCKK